MQPIYMTNFYSQSWTYKIWA